MVASSIVRSALALALAAPLLACAPADDPPQPKGDVVIGGHTYRLPDEAFADGLVDHGPQDQLLLDLPLPETLAQPPEPGEDPDSVQLLLTAPRTSDEWERQRQVLADVSLEAHISASLLAPKTRPLRVSALRAADAPPELIQIVSDHEKDMAMSDVFLKPPISATTEVLSCNRIGPAVNFPHCTQYFTAPGFEVKAFYDRKYILHHKDLEAFVLSYLRQHRVS